MTGSRGCAPAATTICPSPNAFSELLARVEVLARRPKAASHAEATRYSVGGLELDRLSRTPSPATVGDRAQPREFRLLEYLMKHAGQVVDAHHAARGGVGTITSIRRRT